MASKVLDEEALFHAARRIADPGARALFLAQACRDDAALAERVRTLLELHEQESAGLESSPPRTVDYQPVEYQPVAERPGSRVGPYRLMEQIGEGGFGLVFVADQQEPVKRRVALKIIKPGMDTRQVIARFEAERQALALMEHPNIAKVLDAGATDSGRPYFVMELVRGIPITEFCDQGQSTPRQRLELFVDVCHAIQHAHQKGMIHRDIKPSNVLVTLHDGRPVVKVIDFGVAKAIGQSLTDKTVYTQFAQMIGTPLYMSPEQAAMSGLDIDTRSDIYSLGVLLYELLTGSTPLDRTRFTTAAFDEMRRLIREEEPPRPSQRLSTCETRASVAAARNMEPAKLSRLLRGELDWVVMKALEKDRTRRYETANGLARDIQRYLADELVEARPPSAGYRLRKFVRRHKGQVLAASVVLGALVAGIAGTTWGLIRAEQQRVAADDARLAEAERVQERDQALNLEAKRVLERDAALQQEAERVRERDAANDQLSHRLGVSELMLAGAADDHGDVRLTAERLDRVPEAQRGWEWRYLKQQSAGGLFTIPALATKSLVFSPDGTRFATGGRDSAGNCEVKVWDARTGLELLAIKDLPNYPTSDFSGVSVAYSPDGARIVVGDGSKTAKVYDAQTGTVRLELKGHTTGVMCAVFSPDGTRIVTGGDALPRSWDFRGTIQGIQGPGETKVWDAQTGMVLFELQGHTGAVTSIAYSPDGTRIVTGGGDFNVPNEVKVWDANIGGRPLFERQVPANMSWKGTVAFSPDGTRIVTGNEDGTATVLDAKTGAVLLTLTQNMRGTYADQLHDTWTSTGVTSAAFSPDGMRIVGAGGCNRAGLVTIWDARTGAELLALKGHKYLVTCAAFSPDGTRLVTGCADGTVKMWDAATGTGRFPLTDCRSVVSRVAFSPDGTRFATANLDGTATVWDTRSVTALLELNAYRGPTQCVAFSPDGSRIVTGGGGFDHAGHATVWDARSGNALFELRGFQETVLSVAFSPDGTRIVTGGAQEVKLPGVSGGYELKVWDARTGTVLHDLTAPEPQQVFAQGARGWTVAFSPDGSRFVAAGGNCGKSLGNRLAVHDVQTGKVLVEKYHDPGPLLSVAYSADGTRIATGGMNNTAQVWDADTGALLVELKGHQGAVLAVTFSADGSRIVTGSRDRSIKLWDVRTGLPVLDLKVFRHAVQSVAFSPDGTQLLTGGGDAGRPGEAYLWDARDPQGEERIALHPDQDELAYRRVHTEVNRGRYRDGYRAARAARDEFAARFYLDLLPPAEREALVARSDVDDVAAQSNKVRGYMREGKSDLAISLLNEIVEIKQQKLGAEHPDTLDSLQQLAAIRRQLRQFDQSIPLLERLLRVRQSQLGRDHIRTCDTVLQLAGNYTEAGRPQDAIPLYQQMVDLAKAKLGPNHPETLLRTNQLGVAFWQTRQFDKSVPLFEELVQSCLAIHGRDHLDSLRAVGNLGVNYKDAGRLREAIPLLEEAHQATTKYPALRFVTGHLVDAYAKSGKIDAATALFLENLAFTRQSLPADSPQLADTLAQAGLLLLQFKQWATAETTIRECLAIREKIQPDAWNTFNSRVQLGAALLGQQRYAEAEPLLLQGYEGLKQREASIPPPGRIRLPEALDRLIELYTALNKPDDIAKWQAERAKYATTAPTDTK